MRAGLVVAAVWTATSVWVQAQEEPDLAPGDTPEEAVATTGGVSALQIELPPRIVGRVSFDIVVHALDDAGEPVQGDHGAVPISSTELKLSLPDDVEYEWVDGTLTISGVRAHGGLFKLGHREIHADLGSIRASTDTIFIPGLATLLPSLFAIVLALATREVLLSLLLGVWMGAVVVGGGHPLRGIVDGMGYLVASLSDPNSGPGPWTDSGHAEIIIFTVLIGGMVALINRTGGTRGLVAALQKLARSPRSGQVSTWLMGMAVFFDDYASLLLTGSTMRGITDRLRISREKLSFIVDATAAPVANIALISTWVGYELSQIQEGFKHYDVDVDAWAVFLGSIPYRFYPLLMLTFVVTIAVALRDFGPMYRAEMRTRRSGRVLRQGATPTSTPDTVGLQSIPPRWWNAVIPIVVMILAVMIGLYVDGYRATVVAAAAEGKTDAVFSLREIFGAANSFRVLVVSSSLGVGSALVLAIGQGIVGLRDGVSTVAEGARSMTPALLILVLAWSLAGVTSDLQASKFLATFLQSQHAVWLPMLVFLAAAFISFATGTSFGTMALLTPITIQVVADVVGPAPMSPIMLASVGAVLGGATVGDHVSPISDTTVMSAMSCSADLIDHVRTQMPYAAVVSGVCILAGYLPVALGVPVGLALLLGVVATATSVMLIGKRTDPAAVLAAIRADVTSTDRTRRIEALNDLSGMAGTPLASEVVRLLSDDDEQVQVQALRALGRMRHAGARQAIESRLDSPSRHIRATAVKALSQLGGTGVLPRIIERLTDDDPRVRANAIEAINHMEGALDDATTAALIAATRDDDNRVRATAAMVLWKKTREEGHLGHLIEMVREGSKQAALSAIFALSEVDSSFAVRVLREAIAGRDPDVQAAAAQALEGLDIPEDTTPGEPPPLVGE